MLVFGSSPPITGMRERELDVLSESPLPFSLPKLNRGLPPSSSKSCCWNRSLGLSPLPGLAGACGSGLLYEFDDFSKIVEEVPIVENLRIGHGFEPHMRRQAGALRLQVGDIIRAI